MKMTEKLLAYLLGCKPEELNSLNTIVYKDIDDLMFTVQNKTLDGICEAVHRLACATLIQMYQFAKNKVQQNPTLICSEHKWDEELLLAVFDTLHPKKDLHWKRDKSEFYMELDNYNLYAYVIGQINEDYSFIPFSVIQEGYTSAFYGGAAMPDKLKSLVY